MEELQTGFGGVDASCGQDREAGQGPGDGGHCPQGYGSDGISCEKVKTKTFDWGKGTKFYL